MVTQLINSITEVRSYLAEPGGISVNWLFTVLSGVAATILVVALGEILNYILGKFDRSFYQPGARGRYSFYRDLGRKAYEYPGPLALLGGACIVLAFITHETDQRILTDFFLVAALTMLLLSAFKNGKRIRDSPGISDLEYAGERLNAFAKLQGGMARRNLELIKCFAEQRKDPQTWTIALETFMEFTERIFAANNREVRAGISIYHPDPGNAHRLIHWDNLHVGARVTQHPRGLDDIWFYIGPDPRKTNRNYEERLRKRGMAGYTFQTKEIQRTKINKGADGTFAATNDLFYFDGGDKQDPGFRALITVPVEDHHGNVRAVLSIDSNISDQFENADDRKIIEVVEDLAKVLGVALALHELGPVDVSKQEVAI